MKRVFTAVSAALVFCFTPAFGAQEPVAPAKPTEHVLGTLTGVDKNLHTVTVKEDANGTVHTVQVGETKTLLKVAPGAKDVKGAARITADDLAVGDRVDVRGFKVEADPNAIAARSVILMSARDVQQAHQMESAAWQHAAVGVVTASDATSQKLTVTARSAEGPKTINVDASHAQFTRFSPETPQTPNASQFADIQSGDQVRIIGDLGVDASSITAQKIYSGSFKNTAGTIVSLAADGKSMVVKDLASKQPVNVSLTDNAAIHKLPPMMAYGLARRFNPDFKGGPAAGGAGGPGTGPEGGAPSARPGSMPPEGAGARPSPEATGMGAPGGNMAGGPGGRMRSGDLSQMLEHLPKISISELKPGDAVVVSGSPSAANKLILLATTVVAGVEPIFQSASPRQAQSLGDWTSGLGGGGSTDAAGGGAPPQ